jgi:4-hydroxy-tetrahydrodipicolinate reductase
MINLVIHGAKGRMGQALLACAARQPDLAVVGVLDEGDDPQAAVPAGDAAIDFSLHHATPALASVCAEHRKPLVIGTTGHSEDEASVIRRAGEQIPIVWAANYSTGVNTLFWLVRKAAELLGPDFDIEVVEMHHRLKRDAPSGTAATLAEILAEVRQERLAEVARHGRHGITGERSPREIGVHAVRGGDVVGDHTVIFAGNGERLELTHRAASRETFANGALRAARWVIGKPPGIYAMEAVLGLD